MFWYRDVTECLPSSIVTHCSSVLRFAMCLEGGLDDVQLELPKEMYLGLRQLGWRSGREEQVVDGKSEERRRQRVGG
jgi:hypothetical protein